MQGPPDLSLNPVPIARRCLDIMLDFLPRTGRPLRFIPEAILASLLASTTWVQLCHLGMAADIAENDEGHIASKSDLDSIKNTIVEILTLEAAKHRNRSQHTPYARSLVLRWVSLSGLPYKLVSRQGDGKRGECRPVASGLADNSPCSRNSLGISGPCCEFGPTRTVPKCAQVDRPGAGSSKQA